jgi:hypothetical protein
MAWCLVKHRGNFTFTFTLPWFGMNLVSLEAQQCIVKSLLCILLALFISQCKWYATSVGIATRLRTGRSFRVRFPARAGNFSLHHRFQNGSGAQPASYPMGTRGYLPGSKAAEAWIWPLTSILCQGQRMRGVILPLPQHAFMAWWSVLKKHRRNSTFYLKWLHEQFLHKSLSSINELPIVVSRIHSVSERCILDGHSEWMLVVLQYFKR